MIFEYDSIPSKTIFDIFGKGNKMAISQEEKNFIFVYMKKVRIDFS